MSEIDDIKRRAGINNEVSSESESRDAIESAINLIQLLHAYLGEIRGKDKENLERELQQRDLEPRDVLAKLGKAHSRIQA